MESSPDTIAAPATPVGTSALALLRASGPLASQLIEAIFGQAVLPLQVHRGDYHDHSGVLVDDVIYTFFHQPNSYTGEDVLEISCHGNPFVSQKILEDLFARGCRPAEPGEFTKRAFLNGRMDLSQAEAVVDLIHARSDRALAAANQQLRGALGHRLQEMIDHLLGLLARVEAYIDFPEDDLPPEERSILADGTRKLLTDTGRLLATGHYGQILRHGIKTVILGEPNVGKSSLLNYLVGCDRALVSPEPGTTRDYLEEPLTLGAHCIRLFDTAGLRPSPAPLEQLSITKTLERAAGADLLLLVLDATRPTPVLPPEIETRMNPKTTLIVINKIDLVPNGPYPDTPAAIPVTRISALTGVGCDHLVSAIIRHAEAFRVEHDDDSIAINARHSHALKTAAECLKDAQSKLQCSAPAELLASDLRGVLDSFGEICGRIDNNRLLNHIFASFCVGK